MCDQYRLVLHSELLHQETLLHTIARTESRILVFHIISTWNFGIRGTQPMNGSPPTRVRCPGTIGAGLPTHQVVYDRYLHNLFFDFSFSSSKTRSKELNLTRASISWRFSTTWRRYISCVPAISRLNHDKLIFPWNVNQTTIICRRWTKENI